MVPYCGNDSVFCKSLILNRYFPVCVDAAGFRSSYSEGLDVIQGQQAAWPPHMQHERKFVLGNEQLAVRWSPYGLCIRAQVLPSPKGVRGDV